MAEACVRSSPFLLLAFAATLFGTPVIAQFRPATPVTGHSAPGISSKSVKELPMPMTAPLFLESATYTSTLYLVNQLNFGVEADVSVYDMSGAMLMTGHRYLEANSSQTISIRKLLGDAGLFAEVGSVEIVSPENSAALLGQLSITKTDESKEYLDEELFMPAKTGSHVLRAIIDSPQNSPIVSVTNVSTTIVQTLQIACISAAGSPPSKMVTLQPRQTKLIRACSTLGDVAFSPDGVDNQFILKPESPQGMSGQNVAGISITSDGPPGEIAAFGFVEHADNYGRYFSAMNFEDPGVLNSAATAFAGVPVGPSAINPGSAYTPQAALTNFSQVPQTVSINFATTAAGLSDSKVVAQVTIPANSSKFITLPSIVGSPEWQNSFVVSSSGQPGDVLSKMMFKTTGSLPNIELIGKDEQDMHNAGDHPWSIEKGTRSSLYLFNHGETTRKVTIRIGSGSNVWLKMYTLYPNETKALVIGDLIQEEVKDDKGYAFPHDVTHGEASWWAPKTGAPEVSGRVVQYDTQGTMARNFSCGTEVVLSGLQWSNYSGDYQVGNGKIIDITPEPTFSVIDLPQEEECPSGGETTSQSAYLSWQWTIQNSGVATVTNYTWTDQTADIEGVGLGTAEFSVTAGATDNNICVAEGSMYVPPSVSITGPTSITAGGIPKSPYTLTATGSPSGGTYTFSLSSGKNLTLSNTTTSTTNTTQITGTAGGTATVLVTYALSGGSATNTQNVTVLQPNNLLVANDTTNTVSCSVGTAKQRQILYTIQSGTTPITDPIYMKEGVPNPTIDSCGNTVSTGAAGFNSGSMQPGDSNQFIDYLQDCPTTPTNSCSFSFPNQQWIALSPSATIATIGKDTVSSSSIVVDGNSTSLTGTTFKP